MDDPHIANCYQRQRDATLKPPSTEFYDRYFGEKALLSHWRNLESIDELLYNVDKSQSNQITPFSFMSVILRLLVIVATFID